MSPYVLSMLANKANYILDFPDQGFEDVGPGTPEKNNQSDEKDKTSKLCNQEELEECDSLPEDVLYVMRMDLKDGIITQKVRNLHQT